MAKLMSPNTTIWWIPLAGILDYTAPKVAEITAGINISAAIVTGYTLAATDSDKDNSHTIIAEGNVDTPTFGNYAGNLSFFRDSLGASNTAAPVITLGTTSSTGGTFAAATYYWVVVATSATGESLASNEVTAPLVLNGTQVLNWSAVSGATGYKVFRGTTAGGESILVTTLGAVSTYTDTGTAGSAGVPAYTSSAYSTAVALFNAGQVEGWLVSRHGYKSNTAPLSTQLVSCFRFISDWGQDIDQGSGTPYQFTVPFLAQGQMSMNVPIVP